MDSKTRLAGDQRLEYVEGTKKTFNQEPPFPLYLMKDLVILYILYSDVIVLLNNLV